MLSSAQLKQITTEARPIIERMLDDAEKLAGMRSVVSAAGGDWSQLKALIKAQIKDENDEAGDGKHVRKILDKADYATAYADMLGLSTFSKMNEENFFEDDTSHDSDGVVIEDEEIDTKAPAGKADGAVSTPEEIIDPRHGAGGAEDEARVANYGASSSAEPNSPEVASEEGGGFPVAAAPHESGATGGDEGDQTSQPENVVGSTDVTAGETAPIPEPADRLAADADSDRGNVAATTASVVTLQLRTHNPETHFLSSNGLPRLHGCLKPDACAGSHRKLCFDCSLKHDGPSPSGEAA